MLVAAVVAWTRLALGLGALAELAAAELVEKLTEVILRALRTQAAGAAAVDEIRESLTAQRAAPGS
jgi:hypothetical protein